MDTKTTICSLLRGVDNILVPAYQRAYSWEEKQLKQFVKDLDDYIISKTLIPYYFGHFLFEKTNEENYNIIDGQQRLTTIIIFLNVCFSEIKKNRELTDDENVKYEDMIKRGCRYKFATVDYDNLFFKDYVIEQTLRNRDNLDTNSKIRIADAFDYFVKNLNKDCVLDYIKAISDSICTTHIVTTESEAVQMFIFQNDRGKKPTKLEVIKAQFMYKIHVSVVEEYDKKAMISEIQERFEKIYKASSKIDSRIDEDDVLLYSLRVYFNTLKIDVSTEKIEQELRKTTAISFIKEFTNELESSFESLQKFFAERNNFYVYSLALLGGSILLPFIIKAYKYNVSEDDKGSLCDYLESLLLRHRIISTRAHLEDRLEEVYTNFAVKSGKGADVNPIIDFIQDNIFDCDSSAWWWAYWNNEKFEQALQGKIDFNLVKHLLWRYENFLNSNLKGYSFMFYEQIISPEVEHIAPQTPTDGTPVAAGYCEYDEDFINQYLNCIGNYLLISKSHNCKIGNEPFRDKLNSYKVLAQQRKVAEYVKDKNDPRWTKEQIKCRKNDIVDYLKKTF